MRGTRYEEYGELTAGLPFVLNAGIRRSRYNLSRKDNWHENLEIQLCTEGSGTVLLDGVPYPFQPGDVAVVPSNVIHYTGTDTQLAYDCLIVGTAFCQQMGFDLPTLSFTPVVKDTGVVRLLEQLKALYGDGSAPYRVAKLNDLLLRLLLELAQHHSTASAEGGNKAKGYRRVKQAILYMRDHYAQKISLEEVAKAVLCDKYTLCKEFKRYTGQTVVEHLNHYRCVKAIDCLTDGHTVAETATLCGFDTLSFFSKTFKRYVGKLPSEYKK